MSPPSSPIRVVLAEDDDVYASFTEAVLAGADWIDVAARARNGLEAVELAADLSPDIVLMDIAIPELDGLAATARIRERCPDVCVLVVSSAPARDGAERAAAAGAAGFVHKDRLAHTLLEAIRAVLAG